MMVKAEVEGDGGYGVLKHWERGRIREDEDAEIWVGKGWKWIKILWSPPTIYLELKNLSCNATQVVSTHTVGRVAPLENYVGPFSMHNTGHVVAQDRPCWLPRNNIEKFTHFSTDRVWSQVQPCCTYGKSMGTNIFLTRVVCLSTGCRVALFYPILSISLPLFFA